MTEGEDIAPATHAGSPLATFFGLVLLIGDGDVWRGLKYGLARILVTSRRPPPAWRRICDDLEPTVATVLERCAGWPRMRAIRTAPMVLAAAEIEALNAWEGLEA